MAFRSIPIMPELLVRLGVAVSRASAVTSLPVALGQVLSSCWVLLIGPEQHLVSLDSTSKHPCPRLPEVARTAIQQFLNS
eukprot:12343510-Alexandrium_andersonii.AAC.1